MSRLLNSWSYGCQMGSRPRRRIGPVSWRRADVLVVVLGPSSKLQRAHHKKMSKLAKICNLLETFGLTLRDPCMKKDRQVNGFRALVLCQYPCSMEPTKAHAMQRMVFELWGSFRMEQFRRNLLCFGESHGSANENGQLEHKCALPSF